MQSRVNVLPHWVLEKQAVSGDFHLELKVREVTSEFLFSHRHL